MARTACMWIIDGIIESKRIRKLAPEYVESLGEDGTLSADAIADAFVFAHKQPRTTWTHELDLRPYRENW